MDVILEEKPTRTGRYGRICYQSWTQCGTRRSVPGRRCNPIAPDRKCLPACYLSPEWTRKQWSTQKKTKNCETTYARWAVAALGSMMQSFLLLLPPNGPLCHSENSLKCVNRRCDDLLKQHLPSSDGSTTCSHPYHRPFSATEQNRFLHNILQKYHRKYKNCLRSAEICIISKNDFAICSKGTEKICSASKLSNILKRKKVNKVRSKEWERTCSKKTSTVRESTRYSTKFFAGIAREFASCIFQLAVCCIVLLFPLLIIIIFILMMRIKSERPEVFW